MAEKTYTTNPLKGKETLKRLKGALRNAPVIGTVADVVDIGKEVLTGDYAGAAVATGTALAGITPIGRIASKGAKVVGKKLKKKEPSLIMSNKEYDVRIAELDKAKTAKEWQDNAKELVTSGRVDWSNHVSDGGSTFKLPIKLTILNGLIAVVLLVNGCSMNVVFENGNVTKSPVFVTLLLLVSLKLNLKLS